MTSDNQFGKLPASADLNSIKRFEINIPENDIDRMRTLIELSPLPEPCHENQDEMRKYGIRREWLSGMKDKWLHDFDWKRHESKLNTFPHFIAKVQSPESNLVNVHFVGLFSSQADAMPILLSHGWPGSFLEFLPMLELIQARYDNDPSKMPYHFIVPSTPGFGFSSMPPPQEDFYRKESLASVIGKLMTAIFGSGTKYVTQGGDVGSYTSRILAATHPDCVAAHLNFTPVAEPARSEGEQPLPIEEIEKKALKRLETFTATGAAYSNFQATRPSTLGFVLSSSPLALLAWVGEKFLDWTDPASFSNDPPHSSVQSPFATEILLGVSLYWLTGNIATTFYSYRERVEATRGGPPAALHDSPHLNVAAPKMLGYSFFPMDVMPVPVSWVATSGNLVWSKRHEVGGHFAALEQPQVLWDDLQEFVELVKTNLDQKKA